MDFRREQFEKLKNQINNRKISLLIGPRQVGKTTLLKQVLEELSKSKKCLFLDLDIISNYEKVSSYENLLNTIKLEGYEEKQKDCFYLFLDEFQKYPELVNILKNVYDNNSNVKIYASGSSSLTIKNQVQESLAGRKEIIEIFPLSFREFLIFKEKIKLSDKLDNIKKLSGKNLSDNVKEFEEQLNEFLIFGGYPEVVLKKTPEEKIRVLTNIFDLYIKKDLVEYLNISKILSVKKLIEFLAVNNGQKIKFEAIAQITSLKVPEIKQYIDILNETFLIKEVRPFFTNKNKELVKIPKIYFIDNGVRNYFINNFNKLSLRSDSGFLFEGFVLSELIKLNFKNIKFWNDKNLEEVDFIIEKNLVPIEVKFKKEIKSNDLSGLNNFLKNYKVKKAFLINLSRQNSKDNISFILPYNLKEIQKVK